MNAETHDPRQQAELQERDDRMISIVNHLVKLCYEARNRGDSQPHARLVYEPRLWLYDEGGIPTGFVQNVIGAYYNLSLGHEAMEAHLNRLLAVASPGLPMTGMVYPRIGYDQTGKLTFYGVEFIVWFGKTPPNIPAY